MNDNQNWGTWTLCHFIPNEDTINHTHNLDCPCNPKAEYHTNGTALVYHNAADKRDMDEVMVKEYVKEKFKNW